MLVNYKKENISVAHAKSGATFTFIPGINDVPSQVWKDLNSNKHFKADVDQGHYVVAMSQDHNSDENDENAPALLTKADKGTDIFGIIRDTYDLKVLKDMKRNETRRDVVSAIDQQIAKLQEERRIARGQKPTDDEEA